MKLWNANGILIQGINDVNCKINNFRYLGVNAFYQYPLMCINDIQCKELTKEQQFKKIGDNQYFNLEFISDINLYERYIKMCFKKKISIRALFIESGYSEEIWNGLFPQMEFMGYEYCPIPIDEQIITDLDWYQHFSKYWKDLNEYGLFNTYNEVKRFADSYRFAFDSGKVGDGEMSAYICRVSHVIF